MQLRVKHLAATRPEIKEKTGVSERTIARYERNGIVNVPGAFLRKMAELSGVTFNRLRFELAPDAGEIALEDIDEQETLSLSEEDHRGKLPKLTAPPRRPIEENVERYTEQAVDEIPMFDLSLSAGPWSDVLDVPDICDPQMIQRGLFRVRISGNSMSPDYKSGMILEFRCLRPGEDRIEVGKDYYVQRDDGSATFKRVEAIYDGHIVLQALNRKLFPQPFEVQRSEITRMARCVGVFDPR
jgi:SOS-response transcriptional repressor LexA